MCGHDKAFYTCKWCISQPKKFQQEYQEQLEELSKLISSLPADLKVFWCQLIITTTASLNIQAPPTNNQISTDTVFSDVARSTHDHCLKKLSKILEKMVPVITGSISIFTNEDPQEKLTWKYLTKNTPTPGWVWFQNRVHQAVLTMDANIKDRAHLPR